MLLSRRGLYVTGCTAAVVLVACAEGSKLDDDSTVGPDGAGGARSSSTAVGSQSTGGGTVYTPGSSKGGATTTIAKGGATSVSGLGGATAVVVGMGGITSAGGTTSARTTATTSTVMSPASGLGIKVVTISDANGIGWNLLLVNSGSSAVDLATVTIRYYFTIDSMVSPKYESYYVSHSSTAIGTFVEVDYADANRYLLLTLGGSGVLAAGAVNNNDALHVDGNLHDGTDWNLRPSGSNDYSYSVALGYNDKITVYSGGTLVWGVEPGTVVTPTTGTGGTGAGGESSIGGSSAVGGESATGGTTEAATS